MLELIKEMYAPFFRQWRQWSQRERALFVWWLFSLLLVLGCTTSHFLVMVLVIVNFAVSSKYLLQVSTDELGDD